MRAGHSPSSLGMCLPATPSPRATRAQPSPRMLRRGRSPSLPHLRVPATAKAAAAAGREAAALCLPRCPSLDLDLDLDLDLLCPRHQRPAGPAEPMACPSRGARCAKWRATVPRPAKRCDMCDLLIGVELYPVPSSLYDLDIITHLRLPPTHLNPHASSRRPELQEPGQKRAGGQIPFPPSSPLSKIGLEDKSLSVPPRPFPPIPFSPSSPLCPKADWKAHKPKCAALKGA